MEGIFRGDSVKILPQTGASMEDLIDYIEPTIRKNPNIVIIHTSTNDLQNNWNIVIEKDHSLKTAFYSVINREDKDFKDKINDVNNKLL